MSPYEQMATLLATRLSKTEFLHLQELLDGDSEHSLSNEVSKIASIMAPELFVQEGEKHESNRVS